MHLQPNRNYVSNDDVQTPPELARRIVAHFRPRGRILEPCAGEGNFLRALQEHAGGASRRSGAKASRRGPSSLVLGRRSSRVPPSRVHWCELKRGRDFFAWGKRVDWVVTNPPWSQFRAFLQHGMRWADHVVFLVTVNHLWTKARLRDIRAAGFGLKEILLVDTPASFPPLGFQLGAVHLARGWRGRVMLKQG